MSDFPLVSVIIPHYSGTQILQDCLASIEQSSYSNKEVIVVDNNSTDGSVDFARARFPRLQVVENDKNLGYAGGCNSGFARARGTYILCLNNDAVLARDAISKVVGACEQDAEIAACQPKILSLNQRNMFDYAGAAGGLMDRFGYPFAKGRIFFTIEPDEGQYDDGSDIFWASGAGMLIRKVALDMVGFFDEDYFAHMEEIDLCWRFHLAGYRVISTPSAIVYHSSATTLKSGSFKKLFLNHRNSLLMLLKNYQPRSLIWIFPVRIFLELMTVFYALLKLDFIRLTAVCRALAAVTRCLVTRTSKRREISRIRKASDREVVRKMYRRSIVFDYFLRGLKRTQDLDGSPGSSTQESVAGI